MKEARRVPVGHTVQGVHCGDQVGQVDLSEHTPRLSKALVTPSCARSPGPPLYIAHTSRTGTCFGGRLCAANLKRNHTTSWIAASWCPGSGSDSCSNEPSITRAVGQPPSWMWSARRWRCHAATRIGNPVKPFVIALSSDALIETPDDEPEAFTVHQPVRCFAPCGALRCSAISVRPLLSGGAPDCRTKVFVTQAQA